MQSRVPVFFQAPHRVMFMAGTTQGVLAFLWWTFDLAARYGGLVEPRTSALPSGWIHACLVIFGFFPFFIFGFLMTAGPRWQGADPVRFYAYVASFAAMSVGWLGFYAGFLVPELLVPALALALIGWCLGLLELVRVMRHPSQDKRHITIVVLAQSTGALCLAAFLGFVVTGKGVLAQAAITGGLWFYLLPVFVTVVHRMLPFFSAAVLRNYRGTRPYWTLYALLACFVLHGVLALFDLSRWTWPSDFAAASVALYLSRHWEFRRSFAVRMLAVLHVSFLWLGISMLLFGVQSIALLLGRSVLGLAPIHALTIGFFASLLIGMVTRVTLGHSGRGVASDGLTWMIFWGIQFVAVLRFAGEFLHLPGAGNLYLWAAVAWLVFYGCWYALYAPIYLKRRSDGESG